MHSFFTSFERRRERAAENRAKGTSTSGAETQGEFVRVRPAPIEEAMGPVHVGTNDGEEARARARARRDDDDDARRGVFERAAPKGSFVWMSVERYDDCERGRRGETASTRPTTTMRRRRTRADAAAREAKRMDVELDGAMPVNEDELARARGVLRNALVGLKERDDRAPGAQWIDRFKPLRGSDVADATASSTRCVGGWASGCDAWSFKTRVRRRRHRRVRACLGKRTIRMTTSTGRATKTKTTGWEAERASPTAS